MACLGGGKRDFNFDPPTSPNAIMQRAKPLTRKEQWARQARQNRLSQQETTRGLHSVLGYLSPNKLQEQTTWPLSRQPSDGVRPEEATPDSVRPHETPIHCAAGLELDLARSASFFGGTFGAHAAMAMSAELVGPIVHRFASMSSSKCRCVASGRGARDWGVASRPGTDSTAWDRSCSACSLVMGQKHYRS